MRLAARDGVSETSGYADWTQQSPAPRLASGLTFSATMANGRSHGGLACLV